jgi:predicted secreted Zn-dependent protease
MKIKNLLLVVNFILISSCTANAEVITDIRVEQYNISGSTSQELKTQMSVVQTDGRISAAFTDTAIKGQLVRSRSGGSCRVDKVIVRVTVVQRVPNWTDKYRGTQELQNKWDSWYSVTKSHEDQHLAIGLRVANDLDTVLQSVRWSSDCQTMQDQLRNESARVLSNLPKLNDRYDYETNHGMNDGTRW